MNYSRAYDNRLRFDAVLFALLKQKKTVKKKLRRSIRGRNDIIARNRTSPPPRDEFNDFFRLCGILDGLCSLLQYTMAKSPVQWLQVASANTSAPPRETDNHSAAADFRASPSTTTTTVSQWAWATTVTKTPRSNVLWPTTCGWWPNKNCAKTTWSGPTRYEPWGTGSGNIRTSSSVAQVSSARRSLDFLHGDSLKTLVLLFDLFDFVFATRTVEKV